MLQGNYQRFLKQSQGLMRDFHTTSGVPFASEKSIRDASHQMLVVRLQDYWGHFVRRLITLSASGLATTISGKSVRSHHGFSRFSEVNQWVVCNLNTASREPDWHVAEASIGLAKKLQISNSRDISAALGSVNSPEGEVRIYRNFIVHRNQFTADKAKVQSRNLGYRRSALHLLPTEFSQGGELVFDRWVKGLQLVARVASD